MSIENVKTIQGIYEAFGKGDIAGIAARCAPDTVWGFAAAYPEQVPWHAEVRGVDALGPFFASMGESVAFETFAPREFVHCGPHVLGLEAILRVQHRGHLVPLNRPPRGWDRTWGWRWVVPVDEAEGVDEPSEAQKSGAER